MERTLIILKPDGVCKKHTGDIIKRFEQEGFKLVGLKMLHLDRQKAEGFYAVHQGKHFFEPFMHFIVSAPSVIMVWEGKDVVLRAREIMGSTNSPEAKEGTLRRLWGTDNRRNLIHGSESKSAAATEISYFFNPDELYSYESGDWDR